MTTLLERITHVEGRVAELEPTIQAFLPEAGRFERLRTDAEALATRYPSGVERPPLFGTLVGVKDIFHVDGFTTRAGSRLPVESLQGPEAEGVSRLRRAGGLVVGKTVTTEFACFAPGPTRNPRNLAHTPGGSSSGSAAAVAAGFCDLALGTQTIGSLIRPAAFCGVFALKPSFGRVPTHGVIPVAPSLDHVGCFTPDASAARLVARVLYDDWDEGADTARRPVLGVPTGPYLECAEDETRQWFERVCRFLVRGGYDVRHVPAMPDFDVIRARHDRLLTGEMARVHAAWFGAHESLYRPKTAALIRRGQDVTDSELDEARSAAAELREALSRTMVDRGLDAWIAPSAPGPAPRGLESTGDPVMNLPWTQAGLPAANVPAGTVSNGLPLGLQIVGRWYRDESLLAWAQRLEETLRPVGAGG